MRFELGFLYILVSSRASALGMTRIDVNSNISAHRVLTVKSVCSTDGQFHLVSCKV